MSTNISLTVSGVATLDDVEKWAHIASQVLAFPQNAVIDMTAHSSTLTVTAQLDQVPGAEER